jgi:hypothetical protein
MIVEAFEGILGFHSCRESFRDGSVVMLLLEPGRHPHAYEKNCGGCASPLMMMMRRWSLKTLVAYLRKVMVMAKVLGSSS